MQKKIFGTPFMRITITFYCMKKESVKCCMHLWVSWSNKVNIIILGILSIIIFFVISTYNTCNKTVMNIYFSWDTIILIIFVSACQDYQQSSQSPPIAGLRTVDPLPLREDPWPSSRISNKPFPATIAYPVSRPVEDPYLPLPRQWSPSCRIQGALRDPEFQHNGKRNGYMLVKRVLDIT